MLTWWLPDYKGLQPASNFQKGKEKQGGKVAIFIRKQIDHKNLTMPNCKYHIYPILLHVSIINRSRLSDNR